MGVEYRGSAAFGFAWDGECPPVIADMDPYDGEMNDWLVSNGWDLIEFGTGGNNWSGEKRWAVIAKGTEATVDRDTSSNVQHLNQPSLDAIGQLVVAQATLGIRGDIGWKLFWDVF